MNRYSLANRRLRYENALANLSYLQTQPSMDIIAFSQLKRVREILDPHLLQMKQFIEQIDNLAFQGSIEQPRQVEDIKILLQIGSFLTANQRVTLNKKYQALEIISQLINKICVKYQQFTEQYYINQQTNQPFDPLIEKDFRDQIKLLKKEQEQIEEHFSFYKSWLRQNYQKIVQIRNKKFEQLKDYIKHQQKKNPKNTKLQQIKQRIKIEDDKWLLNQENNQQIYEEKKPIQRIENITTIKRIEQQNIRISSNRSIAPLTMGLNFTEKNPQQHPQNKKLNKLSKNGQKKLSNQKRQSSQQGNKEKKSQLNSKQSSIRMKSKQEERVRQDRIKKQKQILEKVNLKQNKKTSKSKQKQRSKQIKEEVKLKQNKKTSKSKSKQRSQQKQKDKSKQKSEKVNKQPKIQEKSSSRSKSSSKTKNQRAKTQMGQHLNKIFKLKGIDNNLELQKRIFQIKIRNKSKQSCGKKQND